MRSSDSPRSSLPSVGVLSVAADRVSVVLNFWSVNVLVGDMDSLLGDAASVGPLFCTCTVMLARGGEERLGRDPCAVVLRTELLPAPRRGSVPFSPRSFTKEGVCEGERSWEPSSKTVGTVAAVRTETARGESGVTWSGVLSCRACTVRRSSSSLTSRLGY